MRGEHVQSAVRAGDGNVIHFGQIMVVGGQPENRDGVDSGRGGFFREFDRGQRFVDREHRAAEKSNLLPGDDRRRAFAQTIKIGQRLRRGVPRFVLALQNGGDALAAGGIVGNPCGFFFQPFMKMRRPGIERLDLGLVCEEVGEQARGVRDLGERETVRLH